MKTNVDAADATSDTLDIDAGEAMSADDQVLTVDYPDIDDSTGDDESDPETGSRPARRWPRILGFWVLPVLALVIAGVAGYLKFEATSARSAELAQIESMQTAKDVAVAMLSYSPDTVEASLNAASEQLTGDFRESYLSLINDVVIPGAKEQQITATATVPAAAAMSATGSDAKVLVFVNQAIVVGNDAPTDTASAVEVTLVKQADRWLVSGFDPR